MTRSACKTAKVFMTGRSQAIRLPKEFRVKGKEVLIHRKGNALVLEPAGAREWPEDYVKSFGGVSDDLSRPPQGTLRKRLKLR